MLAAISPGGGVGKEMDKIRGGPVNRHMHLTVNAWWVAVEIRVN